jgi:hypothetical protein
VKADDGARTRDLRLGKPTLYQLSYVRKWGEMLAIGGSPIRDQRLPGSRPSDPGAAVDPPPGARWGLAVYGWVKTGVPTPKNRFPARVADTLPPTPSQIP